MQGLHDPKSGRTKAQQCESVASHRYRPDVFETERERGETLDKSATGAPFDLRDPTQKQAKDYTLWDTPWRARTTLGPRQLDRQHHGPDRRRGQQGDEDAGDGVYAVWAQRARASSVLQQLKRAEPLAASSQATRVPAEGPRGPAKGLHCVLWSANLTRPDPSRCRATPLAHGDGQNDAPASRGFSPRCRPVQGPPAAVQLTSGSSSGTLPIHVRLRMAQSHLALELRSKCTFMARLEVVLQRWSRPGWAGHTAAPPRHPRTRVFSGLMASTAGAANRTRCKQNAFQVGPQWYRGPCTARTGFMLAKY